MEPTLTGGSMKEKSFVGSWIRQTVRGKKQYYSVIDAIAGVTGSKNPRDYWYRVNRPDTAASSRQGFRPYFLTEELHSGRPAKASPEEESR